MKAICCCLPTFRSLAMAQDNVNYCHNDTAFQTEAVIIFYGYPRASPFDEYTMTAEHLKERFRLSKITYILHLLS
jgi:hypothetical protein